MQEAQRLPGHAPGAGIDGGRGEHDGADPVRVADGELGRDLAPHRVPDDRDRRQAFGRQVRRDQVGVLGHRERDIGLRCRAEAREIHGHDDAVESPSQLDEHAASHPESVQEQEHFRSGSHALRDQRRGSDGEHRDGSAEGRGQVGFAHRTTPPHPAMSGALAPLWLPYRPSRPRQRTPWAPLMGTTRRRGGQPTGGFNARVSTVAAVTAFCENGQGDCRPFDQFSVWSV